MSEFKPIRTTSDNLNNISVVDGQFILTTDTGCIYVDFGSTRVQIGVAVNQGSSNSGKYLTVNSNGDVTNTAFPVASTSVVGGVKVDGTSITVTNAGVISAADQLTALKESYNAGYYLKLNGSGTNIIADPLPVASTSNIGAIAVDGTVTSVNSSSVLKIDKNVLLAGRATNSITIGVDVDRSSNYDCGTSSVAIGYAAWSKKAYDISIGYQAYANGPSGVALGSSASADSEDTVAIGTNSSASGTDAVAVGSYSTAAHGAIQLGSGSASANTFGVNSYQLLDLSTGLIPSQRLPTASTSSIGGIKVDGTIASINASNQLSISKNALLAGTGTDSIAIGTGGSSGTGCIFIGTGTTGEATGKGSIAIGFAAEALSDQDIAFGSFASAEGTSVGNIVFPSLAIGYNAVASNGSIQIGYGSNNTTGTLNVGFRGSGNYCLLTSSGIIPKERLPIADTVNQGAVRIDGTTITISNGTISALDRLGSVAISENEGKYLTIDSSGDVVASDLPLYNGGVS